MLGYGAEPLVKRNVQFRSEHLQVLTSVRRVQPAGGILSPFRHGKHDTMRTYEILKHEMQDSIQANDAVEERDGGWGMLRLMLRLRVPPLIVVFGWYTDIKAEDVVQKLNRIKDWGTYSKGLRVVIRPRAVARCASSSMRILLVIKRYRDKWRGNRLPGCPFLEFLLGADRWRYDIATKRADVLSEP